MKYFIAPNNHRVIMGELCVRVCVCACSRDSGRVNRRENSPTDNRFRNVFASPPPSLWFLLQKHTHHSDRNHGFTCRVEIWSNCRLVRGEKAHHTAQSFQTGETMFKQMVCNRRRDYRQPATSSVRANTVITRVFTKRTINLPSCCTLAPAKSCASALRAP